MPTPELESGSEDPEGTGAEFAPTDLTDHRERWDWKSKWPWTAWIQILFETTIVVGLAVALPFLLLRTWDGGLADWLAVPKHLRGTFRIYATAWLGGVLGGDTFALKWLYHSVAHGRWHQDRFLWRVATPLISGALALGLTALVRSDILPIISAEPLGRMSGALSFSFVVGYFSDSALAALLKLAQRLFGETSDNDHQAANGDKTAT